MSPKVKILLDIDMLPICVQNLAMQYYNMFFLKESYLNHNRETVLNACIMISAKLNNLHELGSKYLVNNQIYMSRYIQQIDEIIAA